MTAAEQLPFGSPSTGTRPLPPVTVAVATWRHGQPVTAELAARSLGDTTQQQRDTIRRLLLTADPDEGMTDYELWCAAGRVGRMHGWATRRGDLRDLGEVEEVPGVRRPTDTRRLAQAWRLTAAGRAAAVQVRGEQ